MAMSATPFTNAPLGFGPGGPLPAPTPWTTYGSWVTFSGGVVVGSPTGGNKGPGTINASNYFINGSSFNINNYLPLTGGTISGPLTVTGVVNMTLDMGVF
jgi:hypothetical protein